MKKTIFGILFTAILLGTVGLSFINLYNGQAFLLGNLSSNRNQNSKVSSSNSEILMAPNSWSEDTKFTNLTDAVPFHSVAVDSDNKIHVVWDDNRTGNYEIYYNCFDGISWTGDYQVTNSSRGSGYPSIAISTDNTAHIIWYEELETGGCDVYYNSFDGNTWSGEERITNSTYAMAGMSFTNIEVGIDNKIHVVWDDRRDDPNHADSEVYYKFFNGNNWSQDYRVTYSSGTTKTYDFEIDQNGNLHIIYTDTRLGYSNWALYHISYDGIEWSEEFPVIIQRYWHPEGFMAIGPDNIVHIGWYNRTGSQDEIYYRSYDIDNDIWSDPELIDIVTWKFDPTPWYSFSSIYRNLAVGPDNKVYLAYSDANTGNTEIYYKFKDQNSWSEKIQLTNATGSSVWPAVITTYDNKVYIIWLDNRDETWGLYYKYSPVEVPDPILELMNNILQQLIEIDDIIGTETHGCINWILNKLSDKALNKMYDAIDAYLNEKIQKTIVKVILIKIGMRISDKIIRIADKLGQIDDETAENLRNRIDSIQNDLTLLIQMLSELI